jgi:hypothetical protein
MDFRVFVFLRLLSWISCAEGGGNIFGLNWNKLWQTVTETVYPPAPLDSPIQVYDLILL